MIWQTMTTRCYSNASIWHHRHLIQEDIVLKFQKILNCIKAHMHWWFLLAVTLAMSQCHIYTNNCLGFFGQFDTYRICSFICHITLCCQGEEDVHCNGAIGPTVLWEYSLIEGYYKKTKHWSFCNNGHANLNDIFPT